MRSLLDRYLIFAIPSICSIWNLINKSDFFVDGRTVRNNNVTFHLTWAFQIVGWACPMLEYFVTYCSLRWAVKVIFCLESAESCGRAFSTARTGVKIHGFRRTSRKTLVGSTTEASRAFVPSKRFCLNVSDQKQCA